MRSIQRIQIAGLAVALSLAVTPLGCGSPEEAVHDPVAASRGMVGSLNRPIDTDPVLAERVGRSYLEEVGYDEIMRLALEKKWVAYRPANTGNALAQGAEVVGFFPVFTRWAVAAGVASQADSPAPGPGDAAAVGILVIGLVDAALLSGSILNSITRTAPITGPTAAPPVPGPVTMATAAPTTSAPTMPTTLPLAEQDLWRRCNQLHESYKAMQRTTASYSPRMNPLFEAITNNRGTAQDRATYCSLLDERIKVVQREEDERSRYIKDDCDRFDWYVEGTTAAERLARHKLALSQVTQHLEKLKELGKRVCK